MLLRLGRRQYVVGFLTVFDKFLLGFFTGSPGVHYPSGVFFLSRKYMYPFFSWLSVLVVTFLSWRSVVYATF